MLMQVLHGSLGSAAVFWQCLMLEFVWQKIAKSEMLFVCVNDVKTQNKPESLKLLFLSLASGAVCVGNNQNSRC